MGAVTVPSPLQPLPTLAARFGCAALLAKREDLVCPGFAGNKIRSLESLLDRVGGAVLSFGPVGSNWARALLHAAGGTGTAVDLALWRGAVNPAGTAALATERARARRWVEGSALAVLRAAVASWWRSPRPRWLWPGGASVAGVLANAAAARECCAQCAAAGMPPPDVVYVPWGSGTTAAGLALGFAVAAAPTEVVAGRVTSAWLANRALLRGLVARGAAALHRTGVVVPPPRLRVDGRFLGAGYGRPGTPDAAAAALLAETEGLVADPTYGAKAVAALCADGAAGRLAGRRAAWWCTIAGASPCAS